jgi:amino acid transporter, AAT family
MTGIKAISPAGYIKGVFTFLVLATLNIFCWYVFFSPKGIMRLYTPMYGFSIIVVLLAAVVTIAYLFEGWPLNKNTGSEPSMGRGAALSLLSLGLAWFIIYGLFYNFIGRFGVTYFSPAAIVATGETGSEIFNARENTSTALVYLFTAYIWMALTWRLGFRAWPWTGGKDGTVAFSRMVTVSFFSVLAYAVLFHPHVGALFYPPQKMAAVSPWWESFADTNSAYFHLGWVVCAVAVVILSELLWEEYPWRLIGGETHRSPFLRGIITFLGTVLLGCIVFFAMKKGMEVYWGKPFVGGQYLDAPYFRYLHAAEMSGFVILGALIVKVYLGNLFTGTVPIVRGIVRTFVAVVFGAAIMWFYYSAGPILLGTVQGIAQPEDTPLCWLFFMISFILMHKNFFGSFPVRGDS